MPPHGSTWRQFDVPAGGGGGGGGGEPGDDDALPPPPCAVADSARAPVPRSVPHSCGVLRDEYAEFPRHDLLVVPADHVELVKLSEATKLSIPSTDDAMDVFLD